jgi:hypothetical protein
VLKPSSSLTRKGQAAAISSLIRWRAGRRVQPDHDEWLHAQRQAPAMQCLNGRDRSENNENHTFCNETIPTTSDDRLVLQEVAGKIRYLAEQWNFDADQRIRAALSIEKQWNLSGVRNRRIVVTLRARGHHRRGLG